MPILLNVTTKDSRQVWQSPDGQRTITEVTFDYQGQPFKANTFSDHIGVVGWNGDVESYEKPGRNGAQTFVKQAPKENSYGTGQSPAQVADGGASAPKSAYQPRDDSHIKAQWAIGQAVLICQPTWDNLKNVEEMASSLFAMVDRVKTGTPVEQPGEVIADVPEGQIDLEGIDAIMGNTTPVATETRWNPGAN